MKLSKGIHHITAIAGDPQQNLDFYAGILGLRLVKKTVNFDDPSVYHLYYGDASGNPGTILTFFPWSYIAHGAPGRGQAVAISFSIPSESIDFWTGYLENKNVNYESPFNRFGKTVIGLQDPDGLHLELIGDPVADTIDGWKDGPVPSAHAIRGFHGVTMAEEFHGPTAELLTRHLGFEETAEEHGRYLLKSDSRLGSAVEIIDGSELEGKPGKGTIHHIAFRAADDEEQLTMRKALIGEGYHITEVKDRQYFRSVYFHEPGGILFEIATDPPGFSLDEKAEQLGETLKLPPWLESKRSLIEADLPELQHPYQKKP